MSSTKIKSPWHSFELVPGGFKGEKEDSTSTDRQPFGFNKYCLTTSYPLRKQFTGANQLGSRAHHSALLART